MIDGQSLWTDEGCTAIYSVQQTLPDLLAFLRSDTGGDALMPLSVFLIWTWGHLAGTSEWALRSLNILWGVAGMFALMLSGRLLKFPWLPLLMAIQPFFWHYTNEVRPYAGQLAIGCWIMYGYLRILQLNKIDKLAWFVLVTATCLLWSSSVLAPVLVLPLACALFFKWKFSKISIDRPPLLLIVVATLFLVALGIYYWNALARGSAGVKHWSISPLNLVYVFYEIWGASGWGPPISDIREAFYFGNLSALLRASLSGLIIIGVSAGIFLCLCAGGLVLLSRKGKAFEATSALVIFLATAILFFILGIVSGKAFWGRHLAPVFPFFVLFCGLVFQETWKSPFKLSRPAIIIFGLFLLGSCLREKFVPQYQKEDVRRAAELARMKTRSGNRVAWFSDARSAIYYGITTLPDGRPNALLTLDRIFLDDDRNSPMPNLIVFGNRQYFRERPAIEGKLSALGFQQTDSFTTYIIYERKE